MGRKIKSFIANQDAFSVIKKQGLFLTLFLLLIAGILTGALISGRAAAVSGYSAHDMAASYVSSKGDASFGACFIAALLSGLPYIAAAVFFSTSAAGIPFIMMIPFVRGLGYGLGVALIYGSLGVKGIVFALLLVFPSGIIYFYALLLICREAARFSGLIYCRLREKEPGEQIGEAGLKLTLLRVASFLALYVVSALTEAGMAVLFGGFFASI